MQRTLTWTAVLTLTFAMLLNIALFMQNSRLRQAAAAPRQPQPTQAPAAPAAGAADLKQQIERSEKDRLKATRDAAALRDQLAALQPAAQERDQLKQQMQSLIQENQLLHNEVGNLQTMNTIN